MLWSDLGGDLGAEHAGPALLVGSITLVEARNGITLAKKKEAAP
jgi:hypothetical protein